jgi:hypothetical protein
MGIENFDIKLEKAAFGKILMQHGGNVLRQTFLF